MPATPCGAFTAGSHPPASALASAPPPAASTDPVGSPTWCCPRPARDCVRGAPSAAGIPAPTREESVLARPITTVARSELVNYFIVARIDFIRNRICVAHRFRAYSLMYSGGIFSSGPWPWLLLSRFRIGVRPDWRVPLSCSNDVFI